MSKKQNLGKFPVSQESTCTAEYPHRIREGQSTISRSLLQKARFGKGVPNRECYDSPTLALKKDRDSNPENHFNPSIRGEEQNRYQR